jgi:hypothetical protein
MGTHSQVKDSLEGRHRGDEATAQVITPSDRRAIDALVSALQSFKDLREQHLSLRTVFTFLTIATNEGRALNDYARDLDVHRALISSVVRDLCDRARGGGPGLGLVEIREQKKGLKLQIFLTEKGHATPTMPNQQMLLALRPFSKLAQSITIRTVTAFLTIAANEPEKPADLARCLNLDRSRMSKIIHHLADRGPNSSPGLRLIRSPRHKASTKDRRFT